MLKSHWINVRWNFLGRKENGKVNSSNIIALANLSELPSDDVEKMKKNIDKYSAELEEKNKIVDELEKKYLSKVAELLLLSQVHCEIKTEINAEFDQLGVSTKEYERQRVEEVEDVGMSVKNQSFRQEPNQEMLVA